VLRNLSDEVFKNPGCFTWAGVKNEVILMGFQITLKCTMFLTVLGTKSRYEYIPPLVVVAYLSLGIGRVGSRVHLRLFFLPSTMSICF
jgi:hypothetical protein